MQIHLSLFHGNELIHLRELLQNINWDEHQTRSRSFGFSKHITSHVIQKLQPLLPPDQSWSLTEVFLNRYTNNHNLDWHFDNTGSHYFIGCLVSGSGSLCFRRQPGAVRGGLFQPERAEFSLQLKAGDVVQWTREEERDSHLQHGGIFGGGRVTFAARFLKALDSA